jgi:hypothetical protein
MFLEVCKDLLLNLIIEIFYDTTFYALSNHVCCFIPKPHTIVLFHTKVGPNARLEDQNRTLKRLGAKNESTSWTNFSRSFEWCMSQICVGFEVSDHDCEKIVELVFSSEFFNIIWYHSLLSV